MLNLAAFNDFAQTNFALSKSKGSLDKDSFDKLLTWLGADREAAAQKYEECRQKLIDYFQEKGCKHANECADATFDRVVEIILGGRMGERKEPVSYLLRVGYFVSKEYFRQPIKFSANSEALLDSLSDDDAQESEDNLLDQRRQECMGKCLQALPAENLELIRKYYEIRGATEKAKKKVEMLEALAQSNQKTLNALRIEMHRMKAEKLKPCFDKCIKNFMEE
jgi:hypothetical protein